LTDFKAGDIVKLKQEYVVENRVYGEHAFYYFVLDKTARDLYSVIHIKTQAKYHDVNLDIMYERA
jgi:hypothetical protein